MPASSSHVTARLTALRTLLDEKGLDAWMAPTGDPHLSEYLPDAWALRRYLSGFSGSAGTLVITADAAALWTDSRYWDQAQRELTGSGIELMKEGLSDTPSTTAWLIERLPSGAAIGLDARTLSNARFESLENALSRRGLSLVNDTEVLARVWPNRPEMSRAPVFALDRAQLSSNDKLTLIRRRLQEESADALFLSTLDDIAWLTNLRGKDIPCNPVFFAHCLITRDEAVLFVDPDKVDATLRERLQSQGIACAPYDQALPALIARADTDRLWMDRDRTCAHVMQTLKPLCNQAPVETMQPTVLIKSRKTEAELDSLRETMIIDGVALTELFAWLHEQLAQGRQLTELDVSDRLFELRGRHPDFFDNSFTTISAFGPNAAEPHYIPTRESQSILAQDNLFLLDSGGQYAGGTTDLTRTIAVGTPTAAMKRDFTAVLRGHIALATARFPAGVFSCQLDTLARAPLWSIGSDYGHGTGHGVGFCLSVHEGPVSISPRAAALDSGRIVPGLVLSNEPGVYRTGQWGIRTENLVTPVADSETADTPFLRFETLSLCPIDTRLIQHAMLTPTELLWINTYHRRVRETLADRVSAGARRWLEHVTDIV